jgi:peroxiredoxin
MSIPSALTVGRSMNLGVLFYIDANGSHSHITVEDLFREGLIVVFGGPAPFSRLDTEQAIQFEKAGPELKAHGVDRIIGLYCQDAFVMKQFSNHITNVTGNSNLEFFGDGDGTFVMSYGLGHDFTNNGLGMRSERWCAVIDAGEVVWVEHDDFSEINKTHVDKVIEWIKTSN